MKWAVAFAIKEPCVLVSWDKGIPTTLTEFSVTDKEGNLLEFNNIEVKGELLRNLWQKKDRLIAEVGGQSYAFCLQALTQGLEVFRFHSYDLTRLERERNPEKGAKGDKRKKRAELMAELAESNPELLYQMLPLDETVAYITGWIDEYVNIQQEQRIRAQQRANIRRMNISWMPDKTKGKHIDRVKHGFTDADINYYLEREADLLAAIKKELVNVPIWQNHFADLCGVGPSIAARIIGEVRDIRRFPKLAGFRSECGLRVVDGCAAKFRRGKGENGDRVTFNPGLRQALFLFGDQIVRGGEKNPYNAKYRQKKEFYTVRDGATLSKKHIDNRARRAAASDFADDLWRAWWLIEEERGTLLPQSVRDAIHPVITC